MTKKITSAKDVYNHFKYLGEDDQEKMILLFVDREYTVVDEVLLGAGCSDQLTIDQSKMIKEIVNRSPELIITLVHNHPFGNALASEDDDKATDNLKSLCKMLNRVASDHVIIGKGEFFSYKEDCRTICH